MDALGTVLPLLLIGGVFYLLIFRPMQRRNREFAATQAALAPGAEVMMGGGMLATVVMVDEADVVVEAAPGVQLRFTRQGVVKVLEPSPIDRDDSAGPAGLTD
ncbi:MAG: preprotein translocase subunit YajC [Jiangellales bacterium]